MLAAVVVVALALSGFGSETQLRPHRGALEQAQLDATVGAWDKAQQEIETARDQALPEAAALLELHLRMLNRLRELDESVPGLGRSYVPYVFSPPKERFPDTMADVKGLAGHDPALAGLLATPIETFVDNNSEAVALMIRGALVDLANRHGLRLHTATGPGKLRVVVDQEEVGRDSSLLSGTGMHSYTTHVVVVLSRPDAVDITNGSIQQYLGINEARSLDTNLERVADRSLNAVAVELIRRSLLDELGR